MTAQDEYMECFRTRLGADEFYRHMIERPDVKEDIRLLEEKGVEREEAIYRSLLKQVHEGGGR